MIYTILDACTERVSSCLTTLVNHISLFPQITKGNTMPTGRIVIIPFLHGKLVDDGTLIEPDIDSILEKWLRRHPEFRGPDGNYHIIRAKTHLLPDGIATDLVRVTADFNPDLAAYDPTEDADLYEEFIAESEGSPPPRFHRIWTEQCEAAERIEADNGTQKALGYLIGEKLLNFLEVAETEPEWRAEIPNFIAEIKNMFEAWQIAGFLETPQRLSALGHTADEEGHKALRSQLDEPEKLREDARNLMLIEWARELLLEDEA